MPSRRSWDQSRNGLGRRGAPELPSGPSEKEEARRHHSGGKKAVVAGDEEALGRAQEEGFVAIESSGAQIAFPSARDAAALASALGDHSTISSVTLRFFRAATAVESCESILRYGPACRSPSEVFLRYPQLEHRGGIALCLLHLHCIRIVYQLLCDELNELLHDPELRPAK